MNNLQIEKSNLISNITTMVLKKGQLTTYNLSLKIIDVITVENVKELNKYSIEYLRILNSGKTSYTSEDLY